MAVPPGHILVGLPVTVTVITFTVADAVPVQPLASVMVTVYVVVFAGQASGLASVGSLKLPAGLQLYV